MANTLAPGKLPNRRQGGNLVSQRLASPAPAPVPTNPAAPRPLPMLPGPQVSDPNGALTKAAGDWYARKTGGGTAAPNVNPTVAAPGGNLEGDFMGGLVGGVPSGVTPSQLPVKPKNPLEGFDPSAIAKMFPAGGGGDSFSYQGGGGSGVADVSVNPQFEQTLQARMKGETGGPTWDEIVSGTYEPMAKIMDRDFSRARDQAVEDMISRGVLDSSEASRTLSDLALELGDRKATLLGQLGLDFEDKRQRAIESALQSYGILEGNRIQARTTITAANIGAAASIQSASLHAGATRDAAAISAQARLQEAGLNAQVALTSLQSEMDRDLVSQGIDPTAFASDPEYRGSVFEYFEIQKRQEQELMDLVIREKRINIQSGAVAGGA